MSYNAIRKNKMHAKIFEFTVLAHNNMQSLKAQTSLLNINKALKKYFQR